MGFVERELERIQSALGDPSDPKQAALWAAQQALAWVLEPSGFQSPYGAITGDSSANSASYSVEIRPLGSSRSDGPSADDA
jgi:hypothetical protein